jgi:RNA polymerase II subunit A small phosphatase-like protein
MGKKFDIVIYSKLTKEETDLILDELDPLAELISHKMYKDSCVKIGHSEMKDLRVLKKDMSSVIIVDSDATSFPLQLNNAVPLLPFTGGQDSELYAL